MGDRCHRSRQFLKRNKVFFETVAAVLLSFMAITVSFLQYRTTAKQTSLIEKQIDIADKQTLLTGKQTDIANKQLALTTEQLVQQSKQTSLTEVQTNIANMQADLAKKQQREQEKEAAISRARDWATLRELLRPIVEKYPATGAPDRPELSNLSREQKIAWLSEIESLVFRLGINPILIDSRHNYERYLSMLADISLAKDFLRDNNSFAELAFRSVVRRIGYHATAMWWDLGMHMGSRSPEDKIFFPATPEESIFMKGFPWDKEIRKKDSAQPITPLNGGEGFH